MNHTTPVAQWRCFHCDEVFIYRDQALLHFGASCDRPVACQVDAARLRELENQLRRYREEDTDLHRKIARLECEAHQAVRRAEELGYSKGLADGRNYVDEPTPLSR